MFLKKEDCQLLIWNDKKPVCILSNFIDLRKLIQKENNIPPTIIDECNKFISRVDIFDQMLKYYSMRRKNKKMDAAICTLFNTTLIAQCI